MAADLALSRGCSAHYTGLENRLITPAAFAELNHARWLDHPDCARALYDMLCRQSAERTEQLQTRCGTVDVTVLLGDAVTTDWHRARYDVIFHDAFSPDTSPELWSAGFLARLTRCMTPNGVLVTYCAKGQVRRDFESAGCRVERLRGPPGKREMLRVSPVD